MSVIPITKKPGTVNRPKICYSDRTFGQGNNTKRLSVTSQAKFQYTLVSCGHPV